MRIPSGVNDQYIYFYAVDSTDFTTPETGLSSFTVYRSRDGAAAAAFTTPTINETSAANMPGVYELLLDEDMTIGSGNDSEEMVFHISHAGMAPVVRTIELYRPKITAGETLTVSSGLISNTTAIASVSGAVGSVTGAVGSVTGNVGGNVTGSVGSVSNVSSIQSGLATESTLTTVAGYLDTEISAILEDTGTTLPAQIAALNNLSAAQVNAEVDTALADYDGPTNTEMVAAFTEIKGATWASTDTLEGIRDAITAVDDYVDTEVSAIKAKTDLIPAAPAAVSDIPTALENADALLNRDMSAVSDTNARSPLNALRFLRNKFSITAGTLTVTKENDSTAAWTAAVSTDPAAEPITGSDPA